MKIEAKVFKSDKSWLQGMASITIDNCFVVKGIKIINGKNGLFISMPNYKTANGEYKDICFPTNAETRELITNAIMEEYNKNSESTTKETTDEVMAKDGSDLPF